MSQSRGTSNSELLVATNDQSFGSAVVDAVERTDVVASAEYVEPVISALPQCETDDFEGALVDGQISEPVAVVDHLTERASLPVVVLADPAGNGDTIAHAFEAGAADIFPRTTTNAQYELAVERLVAEDSSTSTRPPPAGETTYQQAYEALFEKISEGLVVHDPETGVIVDVNERFCEMNGYERSDLLGEPIGIVMTEEDAYGHEAAREMIQRARTEGPQCFEWRNRRRDGETFPVEVDLTVIELDGTERVLASVQDITERKRREREYEQIFNGVTDPIAVFDPDTGEITEVNEPYHEMIGYDDLETIRELGIEGLSAGGEEYTGKRGAGLVREVSDTGESMTVEWKAETASGDQRYLDITLSPAVIRGEKRVLTIQRDVTERKRREREYEQIFNSVQDAITVHDPQTGEMVDVNETFCELVGYDRETILEVGTAGISVPEEGYTEEYAEEIIADVMSEGQKGPYEWMVETKDGDRRVTEVVATKGEIGGEVRIISINRDVTERKRREREYEQIFNMAGDGIVIHDPESGAVVDANQQVADLLGYDREAFVDRPISEFQATGEGISGQQAREKIQESAEMDGQEFEWPLETSDGETVWVRTRHETGEIDGERRIVAILQDITERKRREQEFEQIYNGVQDAIAVFDPDTLEYLDANEAYLEMFGHESVSELRERGVSGLSITEEGYTEQRGREIHRRVAESGQSEVVEWQGETSSGEHIWLEVKVAPAVIGGEQRTISVQRDVTERKRREQRLEVFNRILRHNLRNQLDVIRSHAEELADRTAGDHAARIINAVSQLAAIGRRARQIDRIMSRDETLVETDVGETIRETVESKEQNWSDVTVTTEFSGETRLRTDEKTVRLAVESALENALEHAVSAVTVTMEPRPDECVITIVDDGPGIPEEALVPIEAGTETTLQHGTGLGLWQLRWSVNKLNGTLSFEAGAGTTVRITVPDRRESGRRE